MGKTIYTPSTPQRNFEETEINITAFMHCTDRTGLKCMYYDLIGETEVFNKIIEVSL